MSPIATIRIDLWTEDAIVLFDWLLNVDFEQVPAGHVAVKQALMDLLTRFEESVPDLMTADRIASARREVSR